MKKRIFDLVFSYNDTKMLEKRYEYLKDFVDHMIVIKFDDCESLQNDKITQIRFVSDFYEFDGIDFKEIIINLNKKFDFDLTDVFLLSKTFEIPDIKSVSNCISQLSYNPIVLEQTSLMWDYNHHSKYQSIGTQIFNYSQYLSIKNVYEYLKLLTRSINFGDPICQCGWNFSTFCDLETFIKNTNYWNNLGLTEFEIVDSYHTGYDFRNSILIENLNLNVPEIFKIFSDSPKLRDSLTLVISDDLKNLTYGDYRVFLTENEESYDDIICYKIVYPKKVLYGNKNYMDFKYDYKKNEILKIFQTLKLIDNDEIHIKIKSERTSSDFICKFSEIKNGTPSLMF